MTAVAAAPEQQRTAAVWRRSGKWKEQRKQQQTQSAERARRTGSKSGGSGDATRYRIGRADERAIKMSHKRVVVCGAGV
eukprot:EW704577.1.p3 GENE.EW704577.1~~EW704577.1.p3  ORF type:complete len:79 (-),score=4.42 EW704577.1:195-431(-)